MNMMNSEDRAIFYASVEKLRALIGAIPKSSENPFFSSKYVSLQKMLEYVEPRAIEAGFVIVTSMRGTPNGNFLVTELIHTGTGGSLVNEYPLFQIQDPQKFAASITYARRISFSVLLNLKEVDDDGNFASGKDGYDNEDWGYEPPPPPQSDYVPPPPPAAQPRYNQNSQAPRHEPMYQPAPVSGGGGACKLCGKPTKLKKDGRPYAWCQECSRREGMR